MFALIALTKKVESSLLVEGLFVYLAAATVYYPTFYASLEVHTLRFLFQLWV